MAEPIIALANVDKTIPSGGGRLWLLRQITLNIAPGEFVTVMGPSGAGKSTLLGILGLLDHVWSGGYRLLGHDVGTLAPTRRLALARSHVGFVFQRYHLLDDLTVYENLEIPLSYRDVPSAERASLVADVLDRFGIVAKRDLFPAQLSGGQQQLVGVARAVIAKPSVILADEPTGSLHTAQAHEIMELFSELHRGGTTIVQVTHADECAAYAQRVVRLRDGWLEAA